MNFKITKKSSSTKARLGILQLNNVIIETPVFMPVGTRATVKTLSQEDLNNLGYDLILANTYHLYLRPGLDVIQQAGGLHQFMHWNKAILTDSGGFQVFSLADLKKINDEGVLFQSHIDGNKILFTPESVIDAQITFGSDIMMCLDECVEHTASYEKTKEALIRTTQWAKRSLAHFSQHKEPHQNLFGIVQGGFYKDLRQESLKQITELNFDGFAIGGLSVGETYDKTFDVLDTIIHDLPEDKPRYFMGLGSIDEIEQAIHIGVDMFDSVMPTRNARNGQVLTNEGKKQLRNAKFNFSREPIEQECDCFVCENYTLSYLHHLFNVEEILGYRLATYHNLHFLKRKIEKIKKQFAIV